MHVVCEKSYHSIVLFLLYIDINECAFGSTANTCAQNCVNIIGSFLCFCKSGYNLDDNGVTCSGKQMHVLQTCNGIMLLSYTCRCQ